jgi:hypothetical protein
MANALKPPHHKTPVVGQGGLMHPAWFAFFEQLARRKITLDPTLDGPVGAAGFTDLDDSATVPFSATYDPLELQALQALVVEVRQVVLQNTTATVNKFRDE